jgi:hypothetical protein
MTRSLAVAAIIGLAAGVAQPTEPDLVTLPMGTEIALVTVTPLSSKTNVKGDLIALKTADDVRVSGQLVIPAGTDATGQISDAQAKGAMGMSGRLAVRPLFIRIGDRTVRLGGATSEKASVTAGAVVGMVVLTPGFTGRSASIPPGTRLSGYVTHAIELPVPLKP